MTCCYELPSTSSAVRTNVVRHGRSDPGADSSRAFPVLIVNWTAEEVPQLVRHHMDQTFAHVKDGLVYLLSIK